MAHSLRSLSVAKWEDERTLMSRRVLSALLIAFSSGCGHSATFRMRNGSTVKGTVESHVGRLIVVETNDGLTTIDKCEVAGAQLPGQTAMVTGGVLSGLGVVMIGGGLALAPDDDDVDGDFSSIGAGFEAGLLGGAGAVVFVTGLSLMIWGGNAKRAPGEATETQEVQCDGETKHARHLGRPRH